MMEPQRMRSDSGPRGRSTWHGWWGDAVGALLDGPKACIFMGAEAHRRLKELDDPKGLGATYVDFCKSVLYGGI